MKKCIGILFLIPLLSHAKPPEVLLDALNGYKEKGSSAFIPGLIKGSALENEKSILAQGNMINQVEAFYGSIESWDILAECELTDRIRTTYYTINYELGPVYGYITTYKLKQGNEVASKFLFHTEAEQILPYTPITKDHICGEDS